MKIKNLQIMKRKIENIKEARITAYGRVQGVNFRIMVKEKADKLGLKGGITNKNDGSVEIIAQGQKEKIDELMLWIKESPGFSRVDNIKSEFYNINSLLPEFKIIRKENLILDQMQSIGNFGKAILGLKKNKINIPKHVVLIPDGNRRWAIEKGLEPTMGHYNSTSYEHIISLFEEAKKLGVEYLSIWGFSTENWNRSRVEINAIFKLVGEVAEKMRKDVHKHKIRFRHIGRNDRIPAELAEILGKLERETSEYGDFNVQICLDYGGRDEIIRTVNELIKKGIKKIDEKIFADCLDSSGIPDVDLIIRTSGEQRTSGFMPFQSVYAELYFTEKHFPDFDAPELRKAVEEYSKRQRRFGG